MSNEGCPTCLGTGAPYQDTCGGCGKPSLPWTSNKKPPEDQCVWIWSAIDQMWEFACKDDR